MSMKRLTVLAALLAAVGTMQAAERAAGDQAAVVKGNTAFAVDLYGNLRSQEGNLFCSPYSISTALAMTYAGARGPTADEMARTLHFTLDQDRLHPACGALRQVLGGDGKKRGYELYTANGLWGQKGYGFLDDFLKVTRDHYHAPLTEVDFVKAPEDARKTINDAVAKETKGRVKDLLPSGIINDHTRLVLTNAIYFKAGWASKFNKNATSEAAFHVKPDEKVSVPMMRQTVKSPFFDAGNFQVLELPYLEKELSMVIFLPKKVDGLAEFEKELTVARLADVLSKLHVAKLEVWLPRFKMTGEFRLKKELSELGMPTAFSSKDADLSGMNGKKNLFLQEAVHSTFIEGNEEGTEAAGATAVVGGEDSLPPSFKADHPFLFVIRENQTGTILFMGRVVNPGK
jgi:serine protease inhibitor